MWSFIILALFCLVGWSSSKDCPSKYLRFTKKHTACLTRSENCEMIRTVVSPQEKKLILKLHNHLRSKTAMGKEHRAIDGSLPQAADMMQMEWDDELAAVAQKLTETCQYGHDCSMCKAVENFDVGQNIGMKNLTMPCEGPICQKFHHKSDWTVIIRLWYDEVVNYTVDWLDSQPEHAGPMIEHLTQVIWAKSWRIGCGFAFYKQGEEGHQYYVCNYGPSGNIFTAPVYTQGPPCSACPANTQCSTSRGPNTYPGLCKVINPNRAPVYPIERDGLLFYCGASSKNPDCRAKATGDGKWKTVRSVGGNYKSIVLSGGQSTKVTFKSPIKPRGGAFCLSVLYRKGPLDASQGDASSFTSGWKFEDETRFIDPEVFPNNFTRFGTKQFNHPWALTARPILTFSVPRGAGPHVLDIRKIEAYDGLCDSSVN